MHVKRIKNRGLGLASLCLIILITMDKYYVAHQLYTAQNLTALESIRASAGDTIVIMSDSGTRLESLFEGIAPAPRFLSRVSAAFGRCAKEPGNLVTLVSKMFQLPS